MGRHMSPRALLVVGLTLYWPMLRGNFFLTPLLWRGTGAYVDLVYAGIALLSFAIAAAPRARRAIAFDDGRVCLVCGLACSTSLILCHALESGASADGSGTPAVLLTSLTALSAAMLVATFVLSSLGWGFALSAADTRGHASRDIALSFLLSFGVTIGATTTGTDFALALLLPALASASLRAQRSLRHMALRDTDRPMGSPSDNGASASDRIGGADAVYVRHAPSSRASWASRGFLSMPTLVLVAVFTIAVSALVGISNEPRTAFDDGGVIRWLTSVAFAGALLVAVKLGKGGPMGTLSSMCLVLFSLLAGAFLTLLFNGVAGELGSSLVVTGRRALWPLILSLLVAYAPKLSEDADATILFALFFSGLHGISRLVTSLVRSLVSIGASSTDLVNVTALVCLLALVLAGLVIVIVFTASNAAQIDMARSSGAQIAPGGETAPEHFGGDGGETLTSKATEAAPVSGGTTRREACAQLGREYLLTDREVDVLEWLSEGNTVAFIAQEHGMAQNTVRTHSKAIYRKIGLHSKQDVINLVTERMRSRTRA